MSLKEFIIMYIVFSYLLLFRILFANLDYPDPCAKNMLELMTAAAPITVAYLGLKALSDAEPCHMIKFKK